MSIWTPIVGKSAHARRWPPLRMVLRYCGASVVSTTMSLTILGGLVATGTTSAGWANVIATTIGIVPSFELNRRWVWGKGGRRSLRAEALPFAALSFLALALSTLAVSLAARWATNAGFSGTGRAAIAELANLTTFGVLWVVQFVVLDRVLFRRRASPEVSMHGN